MSDEWFEGNFFDVKTNRPRPGQILAKFTAMADFVDDWVKKNVVSLLCKVPGGAASAQKVLRNMVGATEIDSIRVPLAIAKDLAEGMTEAEVLEKPYRFRLEKYWWAERAAVPSDNPHWTVIDVKERLAEPQLVE